ncbi:ABC-ATPase domain-containing protein [Lentibacillus saliphilus]|uniref:ABC-ATPase domain-containing protein n=1 Tax=Lentibacillus saliphilus TaxID=2737028 RepID=UPI001C304362|nr:ABC-ATPase domain-containing protein [Lentibacillus saliphilus]
MQKLLEQLQRIDGKGYKAYQDLKGNYDFTHTRLYIDHVQGDPFAAPSKIRVVIPRLKRPIQRAWLSEQYRKIAAEDVFARAVSQAVSKQHTVIKGSGKSGRIQFDAPGQEVLERTAVQIHDNQMTVCLSVGLPANGRRINGREAIKLLTHVIPEVITNSVFSVTDTAIEEAVQLADQQQAIRRLMRQNDWIAFIANEAILPRKSGVSDEPMQRAVPFQSPTELEVSLEIPHRPTPLKGMAIRKGITLIVGGGYHGKSTLLQAIERGVYHHTAGDGREYVLTDPDAVKIRAEDGRKITAVDISPFINNLPHAQQTTCFTTDNASGSTSQAANVIEALEVGASTLLIDEDTSATNFMIRDHRMQQLVQQEKEPITPFIQKINQLKNALDLSTVLVMGGSGDYFSVADTVIMMDEYHLYDVTEQAKAIIEKEPLPSITALEQSFGLITARSFEQKSLQTKKGKRSKTQAKGLTTIVMGQSNISFDHTEQLVDPSQTRMIAEIIQFLDRTNGLGDRSLTELLDLIDTQIDEKGLASFTTYRDAHPGDLARPRRYEIAAVLNRMRTAHVKQLK